MKRALAPLLGVATAIQILFQAWRRARRRRISFGAALLELSEEAWAEMSPEMKAKIDPNRSA